MITNTQIRRARLMRDFSIKEVAAKLDINVSTYTRIERGSIKVDQQKAEQLLEVFNMNYSFLENIESTLASLGK